MLRRLTILRRLDVLIDMIEFRLGIGKYLLPATRPKSVNEHTRLNQVVTDECTIDPDNPQSRPGENGREAYPDPNQPDH